MKIAVDANELNASYTGVGRYLYHLLKYMAVLAPDMEFTLFCSADIELKLDSENIKTINLKTTHGNLFWQNFLLKKAVTGGDFDLLWSPNYYSPVFFSGRSVISMHDVSWRALPDNYSFFNRMIRNFLSVRSLKKASIIFTLSEFSKREIMTYYGTDPTLIKVIHLAIDDSFMRADPKPVDEFKNKFGLAEGPVLGFLGSIFKRRNVDKLIRSYQSLKKMYPAIKLILVGENFDPRVAALIKNDPSVIRINRLSEEDINSFYSSLDLFVYISEYEGFGLPPLEALRCGTVPLLLNKSSLKEIFSGMALFVNHADPDELTEKIGNYLKGSEAIRKKILSEFSKREKYFSWERVAEEHIKLLKWSVQSDPESMDV